MGRLSLTDERRLFLEDEWVDEMVEFMSGLFIGEDQLAQLSPIEPGIVIEKLTPEGFHHLDIARLSGLEQTVNDVVSVDGERAEFLKLLECVTLAASNAARQSDLQHREMLTSGSRKSHLRRSFFGRLCIAALAFQQAPGPGCGIFFEGGTDGLEGTKMGGVMPAYNAAAPL